jgi:hypothetical protein
LPAEIHGICLLEQLPEIIDAGQHDQQTAQGISHRMKDHRALDQQGIDQEDCRIDDQTTQEDHFDLPVADDLPDEIDIKSKFENRDEIDKKQIIDHVGILDSGNRLGDQVDQEKKRKCLEIPGSARPLEYG